MTNVAFESEPSVPRFQAKHTIFKCVPIYLVGWIGDTFFPVGKIQHEQVAQFNRL